MTLSYAITQSNFVAGTGGTTNDGTPIPPTKNTDNLSSVSTIPDGFVIGLGGIAERNQGGHEDRVPLLGSVPLFGWLFKHRTSNDNNTHFYIFIRANVLDRQDFADLRRLSDERAGEHKLGDDQWPELKPLFTK